MGTSLYIHRIDRIYQDHPHAYGDKTHLTASRGIRPGSSPRVWGQAPSENYPYGSVGIIPTRMGTSEVSAEYLSIEKDHPHAYGDKPCKTPSIIF